LMAQQVDMHATRHSIHAYVMLQRDQ
jgi:hypothetical protein